MNRVLFKTGLVAATAVWSVAALAQSSSSTVSSSAVPANTSTANADVVAPKAKELPVHINSLSTVYGTRVNAPTDNKTSGGENDRNSFDPILMRQRFSVDYKIGANTKIQPRMEFDYQLSDPNPNKSAVRQFRWRDAYLKVTQSGIIEKSLMGNDIALDADVRYYAPTSKSARDNETIGAARMSLYPSVAFGKTGFSLSNESYYKYWFQSKDTNAKGDALVRSELYTGPQVSYAVSDKVSAWVLYEAVVNYDTKGLNTNDKAPLQSQADVEPGMDIKIHDRITLSPFLNWYTNQPLYTTTLNVAAAIRLL